MEPDQPFLEQQLLEELAARLQRGRVARGWTQAQMAQKAGVSKRTIERLEQGTSVQLGNWLRVLHALELVHVLEDLLPADAPGPMERLRNQDQVRKRASSRTESEEEIPWQWGDEA